MEYDTCKDCNLECCRGGTEVTINEVRILVKLLGHYEWLNIFRKDNYIFSLNTKVSEGSCIFLVNRQCIIYENRPSICKVYPYNLNANNKPIFNGGVQCSKRKDLLENYDMDELLKHRKEYKENRSILNKLKFKNTTKDFINLIKE